LIHTVLAPRHQAGLDTGYSGRQRDLCPSGFKTWSLEVWGWCMRVCGCVCVCACVGLVVCVCVWWVCGWCVCVCVCVLMCVWVCGCVCVYVCVCVCVCLGVSFLTGSLSNVSVRFRYGWDERLSLIGCFG